MRLIYSIQSIPELAFVPADQRDSLWKPATKKATDGKPVKLIFPLLLWPTIMVSGFLASGIPYLWGLPRWVVGGLLTAFFAYVVVILEMSVVYSMAREELRVALTAAGRCMGCGYDLRETPERCPECGTRPVAR